MQQFAYTPGNEYITPAHKGCYSTLMIIVFPLAFYLLQLLGLMSPIASILTGFLVLIKVVVEWSYHCRRVPSKRVSPHPVRQVSRARVLAQECSLCGQLHRPGSPYDLGDGHRIQVCERCTSCLSFSDHLTNRNPGMALQQTDMHILQRSIRSRASARAAYAMNQE